MEPDEETLQDPAFVAKYGCTTEHFLVRKYYRDKNYTAAVKTLENLERKGYSDQSLTVAKGKIAFHQRNYQKALQNFYKAFQQGYKCYLISPKIAYTLDIEQAILWTHISQTYQFMGQYKQATFARNKVKSLLGKSFLVSSANKFDFEKNREMTTKKFFSVYSLFRTPSDPFDH